MKKLLMMCLLAACELQPAPKQAPPPAGSAAPVVTADAGAIDATVHLVPRPPEPVQTSEDCQKAAVRFTELFITAAPAAQKGIFEQDRANIVRRTEVACTQQGWTAGAMACIDQAKNERDARGCLEKFPAPGAPPAAAGSAPPPPPLKHPSPPR